MKKGGDLTARQIALLVMAIGGFIIILLFLFVFLDLDNYEQDEVCKLSVITRATAPQETERLLPLKCTTKKFCLRTGKDEECNQFIGEENIEPIDLPSGTPEKNKEAARMIEKVSADALYNCWQMMGEGKLDLFGGRDGDPVTNFAAGIFSVNEVKPKCVICSRAALSEELKNKKEILTKVNLNKYLSEERPEGSRRTYLNLFTDEQVGTYPPDFIKNLSQHSPDTTDEMAFIFMQMLSSDEEPIKQAVQKGMNTGVAIGGSLLLTPAGKVTSLVGAKFAVIGTVVSAVISGGLAYRQASVNQGLAAINCGKFSSAKEDRFGCSIFTPIDYQDINKINALCNGGIEGRP